MRATAPNSLSPKTSGALPRENVVSNWGEPIWMEDKRFGYFPQTFFWRGQRYDVLAVEQCRTVSSQWTWDVERHCFRVRCSEGTFELSQDIKRDTWYVDRFERT